MKSNEYFQSYMLALDESKFANSQITKPEIIDKLTTIVISRVKGKERAKWQREIENGGCLSDDMIRKAVTYGYLPSRYRKKIETYNLVNFEKEFQNDFDDLLVYFDKKKLEKNFLKLINDKEYMSIPEEKHDLLTLNKDNKALMLARMFRYVLVFGKSQGNENSNNGLSRKTVKTPLTTESRRSVFQENLAHYNNLQSMRDCVYALHDYNLSILNPLDSKVISLFLDKERITEIVLTAVFKDVIVGDCGSFTNYFQENRQPADHKRQGKIAFCIEGSFSKLKSLNILKSLGPEELVQRSLCEEVNKQKNSIIELRNGYLYNTLQNPSILLNNREMRGLNSLITKVNTTISQNNKPEIDEIILDFHYLYLTDYGVSFLSYVNSQ